MKPVTQTRLHNPPEEMGNCMEACFASLLEIDISEVPEFVDKDGWYEEVLEWLHTQGHHMFCWDSDKNLEGFHIAVGDSPRGDFQHCVIYDNDKMVHDPHPSRAGLKKINRIWELHKIDRPAI